VLEARECGFSNLCTAPGLLETKTTRAMVANLILQPVICGLIPLCLDPSAAPSPQPY
jgi:hypothetical protein